MVQAYILVQTEVGKAADVATAIGLITGVTQADDVTGPYDVIVRAEADNVDDLGRLVVAQIQGVPGITRTLTCPIVHIQHRFLIEKVREPRLGIDIGRVIIDGSAHPDGGDTAFFQGDEATMLATPEMEGAVPSIARLVDLFAGQVWLVSKCGPIVQARTLRWLDSHEFYRRTSLSPGHVRFCRARQDKRLHCEELALTHFVDDHPEVHAAIRGAVDHQYFFGPQHGGVPSYGIHTPTWADAEAVIRSSLDELVPPN